MAPHRRSSGARLSTLHLLPVVTFVMLTAVTSGAMASSPEAGVLVPGRSLGGVRVGWTAAQVERVWGPVFGRCRNCPRETRYFNRVAFRPEGAGVTLRHGRVSAVFTLWAPRAWHTDRGLYVGEPEWRVRATYGATRRVRCDGYDALVLRERRPVRTAVYVVDGDVWGFGLGLRSEPICR
jgi:hypothetical protein